MSTNRENSSNLPTEPFTTAPYTDGAPSSETPTGAKSSQSAAAPKAKKSNVVFVAIMGVVVILVVGAGYMAFRPHAVRAPSHAPVKHVAAVKKSTPPVVAALPAPAPDESALLGAPPVGLAPQVAPASPEPGTLGSNPLGSNPLAANPANLSASSVLDPSGPATSGLATPVPVASTGSLALVTPNAGVDVLVPSTITPPVMTPVVTTLPPSTSAVVVTTQQQPPAASSTLTPPTTTTVVTTSPSVVPSSSVPDALVGRVDGLEGRIQSLEVGQSKILQVLENKNTPSPRHSVKAYHATVHHAAPDRSYHRKSRPVHNHVELIQPKAAVVVVPRAHVKEGGCNLASIVPNRAWIKEADGSFMTYGVGDQAPNGSVIKSIDPDQGILTASGKLHCSQTE